MIAAAPAVPISAIAAALTRIAELRGAGFDLVVPAGPDEMARLVRGCELVIVAVPSPAAMADEHTWSEMRR